MRFKTLKFRRKKDFLYVLIMGVVLFLPLVLSITSGKYQTRESIKLVEGSISYIPYDFKIMAMYQENSSGEYQEINYTPTDGYKINEQKSYCTLDNINKDIDIILKTENGNHIFANLNKNAKCYIWFDKVSSIHDIISTHNLTIRSDFSKTLDNDTTGTMFMSEDNEGISYYFAGATQDNWVKFAGFYWRIIRINGDGTLRIIYSGNEVSGPIITGEATQIGISAFNENYDDNAYVGYMYGTPGSSNYEETHANINDSTIKQYLDNWYENNLISYERNIDTNAGFCGDRNIALGHSQYPGIGVGTDATVYAPADRLLTKDLTNWKQVPFLTFKCANGNDLYTFKNSNKGNKMLSYPIGLITVEELIYGGGYGHTGNSSYYLYTGQYYWTMSPYRFFRSINHANLFIITASGDIGSTWVNDLFGVRPVINLKADTQFSSGDGTIDNPYVVN